MANDHDKFTCGCDKCERAYRSYGLDRTERRESSVSIADYTTAQLEDELKGRKFAEKRKRITELQAEIDKLEQEIQND